MKLRRPSFAPARARHAFSLIEIMVAVSLLAIIIVGLLAMFYQVQRAFRVGTAQSDILEGGRSTMSLIVRDLQSMAASELRHVTNCAVVPADGRAALTSTIQDLATGSARTNFLEDFCFLTRDNDIWSGVAYRLTNSANGVGALCRIVESANRQTLFADNSNAVRNVSLRTAEFGVNVAYQLVLDGVVNLTITPCDTNGVSFHTYSDTDTDTLRVDNTRGVYAFKGDRLPAYLDIELAVLEPSALAKFRVREEIGQPQAAEFLARQIGATHVFRQRVAIRPAASDIGVRY